MAKKLPNNDMLLIRNGEKLIGFKEAAKKVGVSPNTVRNWCHPDPNDPLKRRLEYVKIRSRVLTSEQALNRFIAAHQEHVLPPPATRDMEAVYRAHPDLRPAEMATT